MNRHLKPASLLLLLATACSSAPPSKSLSLLPSKQDKLSFEEERLRKMQMVQVVDEAGHTHEWDLYTAEHAFTNVCLSGPTTWDCSMMVGNAKGEYCDGEVLLAMAGLTPASLSTVYTYTDPKTQATVTHTYTVPPQSRADPCLS